MSDNATKNSNGYLSFLTRCRHLTLGSIVGLVIASIGPLFWYCMVKSMSNNWIPALLIGACVGAAVRFAGRSTDRRLSVIATGLTIISCVVGYVWADTMHPVTLVLHNFSIPAALKHLVNDLKVVVLIAVSAYLSFIIAVRVPRATGSQTTIR